MASIRNIKDKDGNVFYPLTHERAVKDSNGVNLETKLAGLESKSYVEAWDGASTPVVSNIPAGVTVTYELTTYTGTLAPSESTIGKVYLVKNGNEYDRYVTSQSGSSYSWTPIGSTEMVLSGYATDADLNEVDKKVDELSKEADALYTPKVLSNAAYSSGELVFDEGQHATDKIPYIQNAITNAGYLFDTKTQTLFWSNGIYLGTSLDYKYVDVPTNWVVDDHTLPITHIAFGWSATTTPQKAIFYYAKPETLVKDLFAYRTALSQIKSKSFSFPSWYYKHFYFDQPIPKGYRIIGFGEYTGNSMYLLSEDATETLIYKADLPYTTLKTIVGIIPTDESSGEIIYEADLDKLDARIADYEANAPSIRYLLGWSQEWEDKYYVPIPLDAPIPQGTVVNNSLPIYVYDEEDTEVHWAAGQHTAPFEIVKIIPTQNGAGKIWYGGVYTTGEIDAMLSIKANASDVTAGLATKANASDVYNKSEISTLLSGKADASTINQINQALSDLQGELPPGAISGDNEWLGENSFVQPITIVDGGDEHHAASLGQLWNGSSSHRFINAADFGFLPSASATTNTAALNNALNGGRKTVCISIPGTYQLNGTIYLDDDTTLICGEGVVLQKASYFTWVFLNRGAATRQKNKNITLIGVNIDVNGRDYTIPTASPLYGLRGNVSFLCVENLVIEGYRCEHLGIWQYALQINSFERVKLSSLSIIGGKDGVHLSDGNNFTIRDSVIKTADDPIALNSSDWEASNCVDGTLSNGLIENCTVDGYEDKCGYFRMLVGAWVDWYPGISVKRGERVVSNGRVYRAVGIDTSSGTVYSSQTMPTIDTFDGVQPDGAGFSWKLMKNEAVYQTNVKNITFRGVVCLGPANYIMEHADTNPDDHWNRSIHPDVQIADYPSIEGIYVENCQFYGRYAFKGISKCNNNICFRDCLAASDFACEDPESGLSGKYLFDNIRFTQGAIDISVGANVYARIFNCYSEIGVVKLAQNPGRVVSNCDINQTPTNAERGDTAIINGEPMVYNGTSWVSTIPS